MHEVRDFDEKDSHDVSLKLGLIFLWCGNGNESLEEKEVLKIRWLKRDLCLPIYSSREFLLIIKTLLEKLLAKF